ncbi:serine/threonine-protein kinase [Azospirillum agricola]|uniref:serine/threonine-protein kinase n=1 Tax=Azospirillum agricola TaxID=1720247 RepID=UPI001CBD98CB|nr:serine/threonine-protein kinase [Azospirillum agricola]
MPSPLPSRPAAPPPPSAVGAFDEAELCGSLAECHGWQGRMVIGIALRSYLDPLFLTPTELIHHAKPLKVLLGHGQLVESAVARIAAVQGRLPGQEPRARRLALQAAVDESWAKARAAQIAFADIPKGRSAVDSVLAAAPGQSPTGDVAYDLRVALSLELYELKSWSAKLDRLLDILQWDRDERLSGVVDGMIGDVLCSAAAGVELLGGGLPPGALLVTLCELLCGRVRMDAMGPNRLGVLNALFRQGKLPQARLAVLDRVRRQLKAPQPLGRGAFDQEAECLKTLLGHLLTRNGLTGGPAMADALTVRYSRRLEQGGASAYRRSIVGLGEGQPDLICRIHYLTAVAAVPAAERHMGEIAASLDAAVGNELLIENMLVQTPDTGLLERDLAGALDAIRDSALPWEARGPIAEKAERAIDGYAKSGNLAARLRQVEPVLRRRTIRLAEIACSGLIREDGALPLMRQHILEIVRQPQFQAELAAQQNNEMAQAEVRRLFELLDRLRQMATAPAPAPQPPGPSAAATVSAPPPATPPLRPVAAPQGAGGPMAAPAPAVTVALPPGSVPGLSGTGLDGRCPSCFADRPTRDACRNCGYPASSDNRPGVHLMPGTALLDRYRVGRVLGQGGFGATYLGWDDRLRVKVAIKEFYPSNLISRAPGSFGVVPFSDEHARGFAAGLAKFLDEARMLARLRDIKEIVGVQDFFEENATAYLVMELLEGRTMKKYLADSGGRIDVRRTLGVLTPIMRALQTIHEQGLIHRDISPDNIFLTSAGERKLLDFGAARRSAGQGDGLTVILKPGYAPPEQYSNEGRQGPWSDVYALCATMYLALTGKTPPDATARFVSDRVPRPNELGAALPPSFEKVLLAGLAMRWQDRPQSMRDLLRGMTNALGAG